jgi:hypothetical protein
MSTEPGPEPKLPFPQPSRSNVTVRVTRDIRLLLIAIWLGASIFFSFAVAPTLFSVLPLRELAGAVVSRSLAIINIGGFIVGLLLLASAFPFRKLVSKRAFALEVASLALLSLAAFVGKWVIGARMQALRAAMGRPIDEVSVLDPLRVAFNGLHGYSVTSLSVAILAGLVAFFLIVRRAKN